MGLLSSWHEWWQGTEYEPGAAATEDPGFLMSNHTGDSTSLGEDSGPQGEQEKEAASADTGKAPSTDYDRRMYIEQCRVLVSRLPSPLPCGYSEVHKKYFAKLSKEY